jgi:formiminotetrahydrofolate cyclodeaminase
MIIAAFIFSIAVFAFSLLFLLRYIQNDKYMRVNRDRLARQQQQQLKSQAELRAQMEADRREFEEARGALLKQTDEDNERRHNERRNAERRDIGHAA